ncbi:hypothetical protein LX64_01819 [Chitinophaga skermanii]|uniref:Uncharacterized protein n=1 Tax=Chitinophaga skermanii TaxID=331697 RepID=A0A327QSM0_9BACT|nr:hypothetical protein [Chitinophaga skermanii]RAJ06692.1 hypothetical protein LX64_01819 [Chitinophaga skermanii]
MKSKVIQSIALLAVISMNLISTVSKSTSKRSIAYYWFTYYGNPYTGGYGTNHLTVTQACYTSECTKVVMPVTCLYAHSSDTPFGTLTAKIYKRPI